MTETELKTIEDLQEDPIAMQHCNHVISSYDLKQELIKWYHRSDGNKHRFIREFLKMTGKELSLCSPEKKHHGITITDVKVVGLCSRCRKEGDKIPVFENDSIVPDKDISCINNAFGDCKSHVSPEKNNSPKDRVKPDVAGDLSKESSVPEDTSFDSPLTKESGE